MTDLKNPRLIYLKGILFLVILIVSTMLIFVELPSIRIAVLLGLVVWSSARFYYFLFYVIEKYVDADYRFSGIGSFIKYLLKNSNEKDES